VVFYGFRFVNGPLLGWHLTSRERAMLIVCPTCAMTYQIELAALGKAGRSVRCTQCKNTWFATPDSMVAEAAAEMAAANAVAATSLPPADDFTDDMASNFSVETVEPTEDSAAAEPSAQKFDPGASEDVETIAARRARHAHAQRKDQRTVLQRIASVPVLIVVLLAVILGALQGRVALVRHFPQTASLFSMIGMPVNLRGLNFMDVKSRGEFVDGAIVLVVEGTIVNLTPRTLEVPRLRFALRNGLGHEVYAWTALPPKTVLGSGDGLPFRTRLAAPPPDGRDVIVRFFSRRDAGLGS